MTRTIKQSHVNLIRQGAPEKKRTALPTPGTEPIMMQGCTDLQKLKASDLMTVIATYEIPQANIPEFVEHVSGFLSSNQGFGEGTDSQGNTCIVHNSKPLSQLDTLTRLLHSCNAWFEKGNGDQCQIRFDIFSKFLTTVSSHELVTFIELSEDCLTTLHLLNYVTEHKAHDLSPDSLDRIAQICNKSCFQDQDIKVNIENHVNTLQSKFAKHIKENSQDTWESRVTSKDAQQLVSEAPLPTCVPGR